jgi:hypothetical protein
MLPSAICTVSAPRIGTFAAQWLAYAHPCQRFAEALTEIVGAILVGQQPVELTPTRLVLLSRNLPHDWQEQRRLLGFAAA